MSLSSTPNISPESLRVAVFSDALPERNGAGAYYHDLNAQLAERVDRVEMFQPILSKRPWMQFALPLPGDSTQKLLTPNVPRLSKQYKALKPNIVIAATPGPFGLLGLYWAKRNGAGFVSAFHTHFEELTRLYFNPVVFKVMNAYLVGINKVLLKRSATVIVNNSDLIPVVEELGAGKVDVMGTPLALRFLRESPAPAPGHMKQVLFAGRLAPEKNVPLVVEAARKLPEVRFVIAGDGPLRKKLAESSADLPNVVMTGWLDRESLRKEMDAASVLLLPSKHETFGTVAFEAMSRGRPAVVSEGAGIHDWEVLREGLVLLKEGDLLEDCLKKLLEWSAEEWNSRAAKARSASEALNHSTIDQWVDLLAKHASEPKR